MEISIRAATQDEATRLSNIALAAKKYLDYPDHWFELWGDIFQVTAEFIDKNKVWVACHNASIYGFAAISRFENRADLEHMWVLPECIGKGVGRKLMIHIIDYCNNNDIEILKIESDPNAKAFYEKFTAKQVGEIESKPYPRVLPVLEIKVGILTGE